MSRQRHDWRSLAVFLVAVALWWVIALGGRCDSAKPRPTEWFGGSPALDLHGPRPRS